MAGRAGNGDTDFSINGTNSSLLNLFQGEEVIPAARHLVDPTSGLLKVHFAKVQDSGC